MQQLTQEDWAFIQYLLWTALDRWYRGTDDNHHEYNELAKCYDIARKQYTDLLLQHFPR